MTPIDLPVFSERVIQVFEALGHKPPTSLAMQAWVQTMKEFAFSDVAFVLDGWLKRSNKPPTPSDVWKACNDARTERIEATAEAERKQFDRESTRTFQRSDRVGYALRSLAVSLREQPAADPLDWARILWLRYTTDRPNSDGTPLAEIQIANACDALRRTRAEANEERAEHRAAKPRMEAA